ncbi:MinD-like ATPase involved in chromosome partitioning or flagellar assembly [Glaciimonas immobilis]|uniref:MinD-like ATPase involved in chromosome partitioning or flagellar assembly n=1 Tax=Glaciimonas immobilis TaxID=728004 RepID=A0A840S1U6_9BURK|nr:MinD-like ATPase involved in chromosome partitioning or flagellar assembly [Glaciimonas immobilis]
MLEDLRKTVLATGLPTLPTQTACEGRATLAARKAQRAGAILRKFYDYLIAHSGAQHGSQLTRKTHHIRHHFT